MAPPTIVIVPAACQPPALYHPLAQALQSRNFTSHIIPLPSLNANPALPDFTEDVVAVQKVVDGLVENGTDVVVLMHSYGGLPGTQALRGLGKRERETRQGFTGGGGVVRLVYVTSYVLREGEYMPGVRDREVLKATAGGGYDEEKGTLSLSKEAIVDGLLHDISAAEAESWATQMGRQSVGALESSLTYAAWKEIPSAYVVCTLDRIVPVQKQEEMIARAQAVQPRAFDLVRRLESGHEPILSQTDDLAAWVGEVASKGGVW